MIRACLLVLLLATGAAADVRVDPARSGIDHHWRSLRVAVGLSDVVPYRVFTLDAPRRLVLDFQGVDWTGVGDDTFVATGRASAVRFGPMRPGWSRLVVDLAGPYAVAEAGMRRVDAGAALMVVLRPVSAAAFAERAGAPPDPGWDVLAGLDPVHATPADDGVFTVVIDPGHGGIDPGAERNGVREADVMLLLAQELAASLGAVDGVRAVLTREDDIFVPLSVRMTLARAAGADLFLSLHADALEEDAAMGASVYTLADDGGDTASARMVERHERGDLLSGVDLEATGDRVATVLMDLARARTGPQGQRFADVLVAALRAADVPVNSQPRRHGQLAVLSAADFPSVLVEAGFLSNTRDRAFLASAAGRARIVEAMVAAVTTWKTR
ncbi:N-acetylmuramoyl-L-alanine amidase [Yoonia sp.]|uniref:N-acetylmuramoyl-L-alanine amidase n=1 Tax=Yoonia sp. TaxID=2212373 RepID=UPI0019FACA64|nr:N-acetylmuramoyl-L-alanine amidase [Yoonia sp.]MBE0413057.1 N-acetylmuramoyl-L-alanine amidase [Yoonia sp.]